MKAEAAASHDPNHFGVLSDRTEVAFALLTFAHLNFALLSHSHCCLFRTVGIRTSGFALVSFALLSFALLSGYHSAAVDAILHSFKNAQVIGEVLQTGSGSIFGKVHVKVLAGEGQSTHEHVRTESFYSANRKLIFGFIFGSASSDGEATGDVQEDFGGNPVAPESQMTRWPW